MSAMGLREKRMEQEGTPDCKKNFYDINRQKQEPLESVPGPDNSTDILFC